MQVSISNVVGRGEHAGISWEIRTPGIVKVHIPPQCSDQDLVLVLSPWADRIEGILAGCPSEVLGCQWNNSEAEIKSEVVAGVATITLEKRFLDQIPDEGTLVVIDFYR